MPYSSAIERYDLFVFSTSFFIALNINVGFGASIIDSDYQGEVQFEVTILNGTGATEKVVIQPSKFSTIVATHSTDKGY